MDSVSNGENVGQPINLSVRGSENKIYNDLQKLTLQSKPSGLQPSLSKWQSTLR